MHTSDWALCDFSTPCPADAKTSRPAGGLIPLEAVGLCAERKAEALCCLALGGLTSPVVAGGGGRFGVAGQFLHREDIDTGLEQGGDKGAAQIVRREGCRPGLLLAPPQDVGHRLAAHAADRDLSVLTDRAEERPGIVAPHLQPMKAEAGLRPSDNFDEILSILETSQDIGKERCKPCKELLA